MSGRRTSGSSRPSLGVQVLAVFSFIPDFNRLLCHMDPHCMAYSWGHIFRKYEGGGGQNLFSHVADQKAADVWKTDVWNFQAFSQDIS